MPAERDASQARCRTVHALLTSRLPRSKSGWPDSWNFGMNGVPCWSSGTRNYDRRNLDGRRGCPVVCWRRLKLLP